MRKAGIWDINDLEEIERKCFTFGRFSRSVMLGFLRHPLSVTIVVEKEKIVASVVLIFHIKTAEIASLGVLPEERRKGLGWMLMTEAENLARRRSVETLSLHVAVENSGAILLYEKCGYSVMQTVSDYYGVGRDAFYMEKRLGHRA